MHKFSPDTSDIEEKVLETMGLSVPKGTSLTETLRELLCEEEWDTVTPKSACLALYRCKQVTAHRKHVQQALTHLKDEGVLKVQSHGVYVKSNI